MRLRPTGVTTPPTDLIALLKGLVPRNGAYLTVAVDGRGGSGKTALAAYLHELLPAFTVLGGDDWFEPLDGDLAWGDFNEVRFAAEVLGPLARGERALTTREYDFESDALAPPQRLEISDGVVVERCFSMAMPVDWDVRIWVQTPREVCLARGLSRDNVFPASRVEKVWAEVWQPAEDAYIAEHDPLAHADVVIDGTRPFAAQIG